MNNSIYVLDSYGLIYRAYYAFINRPLLNKQGQNVSAIFGFFRSLLAVIQHEDIRFLAAAFDSRTPTFRHKMYPEYKATRQKTPEDLHAQIPMIEEILTALGVPVIRCDGFEADDVIATISALSEKQNRQCKILSGDKDLMQLVTDNTFILKPDKNGGWEEVDSDGVLQEWGVRPEKMLDILSLTGDKADNVPGIAGVGDKTAVKYLAEYGSLDAILEHADEIKGSIGQKIRDGIESAKFSRELIKLKYDVPCCFSFEDFSLEVPDYAAAARLLYQYGVPAVAKSFETYSGQKVSDDIKVVKTNETSINLPEDEFPEGSELTKNTGDYKAITELSELQNEISNILNGKEAIFAFDCETDSLITHTAKMAGFSFTNQKGKAFYVPFITLETKNADSLFEEGTSYIKKADAIKELERIFLNPEATVIMHNGKFDYEVLMSNGMSQFPKCKIIDTMIAAWLLQPDTMSFSLESLAKYKLGLETIPFSSIVAKDKTFCDISLADAVPYAAEDADLTWSLWQIFEKNLNKNGLMNLFLNIEMKVLPILAQMEIAGIQIEKEELALYGKDLQKEIDEIQKDIFKLVGHEFNIASPKQLQEVLFTERQLPTGKKTKTGYSTDTAVLEELACLDPVPQKILDFRKLAKLFSTYVEAIPKLADSESRVHTTFIQTGTATGRLSSRDPNLQNIPVRDEEGRKIRQAFSCKDGWSLVSADYSQIELVILAHLSKDKNLCDAFKSGLDVHKATASLIFGVPVEEVAPDMRRTAKTINFGVMYGMSAFRLANELRIPRAKAKEFIDSYFATYNGIQDFINSTITKAEETGYVETIRGRRRYIQNISSKNKTEKSAAERVAVNTPIQGSAADIVKEAMIAVKEELDTKYPDARMLLQVHDELIVECPDSIVDKVSECIKAKMEQIVSLSVPLKVSVEKGKRWGEFH